MMLAILSVYGVVSLAGWLWLPLLRRLFPHTADGGAGIGRCLLLFLGGYVSWLLAAGGAGHASFGAALALLLLAGALAWWRDWPTLRPWLCANGRLLLAIELTGLLIYGALLVFQGWTADITTVEKYTNLSIINSIVLVPQVPPRNAWFGGEPLNYYYLGHWMLAWLSQVSGLSPNDLVIFATPLLAAVCAQVCFTILATLCPARRLAWSLVGACLLLFCGSLNETVYGLTSWGVEWQRTFYQSHIPPPIVDALAPNGYLFEFPAVSILWGEMHAHFTGVPLLLALLVLLVQRWASDRRAAPPALYLCGAVLIGSSYALNSWQYPTMLALWAAASWWCWLRRREGSALLPLAESLLIVPGSLLAVLPFLLTFEPFAAPLPPDSTLQPVPLPGVSLVWSPVGTGLVGLLLSVGLPLLLAGLPAVGLLRGAGWHWLAAGVVLGLLTGWYRSIGLMLLPLAAAGAWLAWRGERGANFGGLLLACAALIVLACDYVFIPDHTYSRSNMVFKFYIQAWVLLALAAPLLLASVLHAPPRPALRPAFAALLVLALLSGSVYPVLRGRQWVRYHGDRWWGLKGMAQVEAYHPHEAAAIRWLQQQPGTGGVLETIASSSDGTDERLRPAHFSALTGRPTPRGWSGHTAQWHNYRADPQVRDEFENIGALVLGFPRTQDITEVYALMGAYGLDYVAFGAFEARHWGEEGRALLARHLPLLWQSGQVQVYGRPADFPPVLAWMHPQDWSRREVTTDGKNTPFRWMQGQQGSISIYSQRAAVVRLTFQPINSTEAARVSLWRGRQQLLALDVLPYQPQPRVLWLAVEPGVTTLEVRTTAAPVGYNGRSVTLAVVPPEIALASARQDVP